MKETVNVNLASQAFTFDKDAYPSVEGVPGCDPSAVAGR